MNIPSGWELVLILLVVVVVFGSKRLPEASRSLGRSMRILKAETKGLRDDDDETGRAQYDSRAHDRASYDRVMGEPDRRAEPSARDDRPSPVPAPQPLPAAPTVPGVPPAPGSVPPASSERRSA